ncbi:uncharacterized protein LOC110444593 [Mizuhopecten yessoensis]|uniref:uncharacterized protein LOC110444593 n=1 Tax=Mizuhopecten yessoensis TaxID=6573 RepID=UPI000B45EA26|nr:uncharacterized protein LOC110444593 [Mizuhopecten yessoensis]
MSVNFFLFLCFFYGYDRSYGEVLDPDNQPRQWQDLVTFVNQKIGSMEHLMNIKNERLDQLESKLRAQETEISSLKELMLQKDTILSNLVKQVTDLKKGEIMNTISDTSIEHLARASSSTSVNSTSDVTDTPDGARVDTDTHTAGDRMGEYNTRRQQDALSDVTIPKQYNRVAPPTPKQTVAFHAYRTSSITLGTQGGSGPWRRI